MHFIVQAPVPPQVAFDAVADFKRLAEWDPFVRRVEVEGPPLVVGSTYVLHSLGGMTLRYEIVELESPHRIVYAGGTRRGHSIDTIAVSPAAAGSEIVVSSALKFSGWVRAIGPVVRVAVWAGGRFVSLPAMRRHLAGIASGS